MNGISNIGDLMINPAKNTLLIRWTICIRGEMGWDAGVESCDGFT
jgi:hypothetical protein